MLAFTLFRPDFFFCFLRLGKLRRPPYNLKTAHDTATKITQSNVLIIFNIEV